PDFSLDVSIAARAALDSHFSQGPVERGLAVLRLRRGVPRLRLQSELPRAHRLHQPALGILILWHRHSCLCGFWARCSTRSACSPRRSRNDTALPPHGSTRRAPVPFPPAPRPAATGWSVASGSWSA